MRWLIVMCRLLYPQNTGGKIRSSKLFECLHKNHDITIVCLRTPEDTDEQMKAMEACCSRLITVPWKETPKFTPRFFLQLGLNVFSQYDYIVNKYEVPAFERRIRELVAKEKYDILLCDFLQPSKNVLDIAHPAKVLFQHNVEAVIRQRQFEKQEHPLKKAYLFLEWQKLKRYEGIASRNFDRTIAVSQTDVDIIHSHYEVDNAVPIATGVDVDFFQSREKPAEGHHLVFTGSMDWLPNEDGMVWFVDEILPKIRREVGDVTTWIVGRRPTPAVQALASHPGVEVTGTVDDVRPYMDKGPVYIVPLRVGSGTRIKIFEAMAMGKAVISTTLGAEGLPITHDENIVLADGADTFASACVKLLKSREECSRLGDAGRAMVREHYTWTAVAEQFATLCEDVVRGTTGKVRTSSKSV